jgi:hypothetical protein
MAAWSVNAASIMRSGHQRRNCRHTTSNHASARRWNRLEEKEITGIGAGGNEDSLTRFLKPEPLENWSALNT